MNAFEKKFLEQIRTRRLVEEGDRVLVAVSGGPDSMAMLSLFGAVKAVLHCDLAVAHCNFQLRGSESNMDECFVKDRCLALGLECFIEQFGTLRFAAECKKSVEETARILRYSFFEKVITEKGYTKIATGHHVNDNAETILFNLFRGVSLPGLKGIRARNGKIICIKPSLNFTITLRMFYATQYWLYFMLDKESLKFGISSNITHKLTSMIHYALQDSTMNHGLQHAFNRSFCCRAVSFKQAKHFPACIVNNGKYPYCTIIMPVYMYSCQAVPSLISDPCFFANIFLILAFGKP